MIDFLCVTTEGPARRTCGAAAALPQSRELPEAGAARRRRCPTPALPQGGSCHKTRAVGRLALPASGAGPFSPETPCDWVAPLMRGAARGTLLARLPRFCWYWVASLMGCALAYQTCHPIAGRSGSSGQGQAPSEPAAGEKGERTAEWTASSGKQSPPPSARPDDGPGEMPPRGMAARGRFYASSSAARERL